MSLRCEDVVEGGWQGQKDRPGGAMQLWERGFGGP